MLDISILSNVRQVQRSLTSLERKQLPFATAVALTSIGKKVEAGERKGFTRQLDRPTPFTMKSIGVKAAKKNNLVATVFMRDKAASYLEPFEFGGVHKMNARAMFNPKASGTNQYGNLPRNLIARLKGRPDIFIGPVKTRGGETVNGVWQRPHGRAGQAPRNPSSAVLGRNTSGKLKLLVRFTNPQRVTQQLHYRERAKRIVAGRFDPEMRAALAKALASARR